MKLWVTGIIISFIFGIACTNGTFKIAHVKSNRDSELAILMRDMFEEGMLVKQSIIHGKEPILKLDYHHINTATPTEAGKNRSPEYQLFSKPYERSVERLKHSSYAHRAAAYTLMIDNCMNCHSKIYREPMNKIKKLYLTEREISIALKK